MESRPRILVVDDEPLIVRYLTQVLQLEGYSAHGVTDSAQVVDLVRALSPELVILDLNMPPPDGFEVMKALRVTHPGLMILGISGYASGALLGAAPFLGATATIAKPVSNEELLNQVKAMIGPAEIPPDLDDDVPPPPPRKLQ
jgi:CheY-like chemotaxis protein